MQKVTRANVQAYGQKMKEFYTIKKRKKRETAN